MGLFNRGQLFDTLDDINYYKRRWGDGRSRAGSKAAAFVTLMVFAAFMLYNEGKETRAIWYKAKINGFIYADSTTVVDSSFNPVSFFRRIRPLDSADITQMDVPREEKLKLMARFINENDKRVAGMLLTKLEVSKSKMFKNETALLGKYLRGDSLTGRRYSEKETSSGQKWLGMIPNYENLDVNGDTQLPEGYTYADEYYYVEAQLISLGEAPIFIKAKNIAKTDTTEKVLKPDSLHITTTKSLLKHKKSK